MQDFIRQIVDELIALDSELASDRESLEALVAKLLAAKPKVKLDAAFRKRLKKEIIARLRESETSPTKSFNPFAMQKLFYSLAGVTVALLLVLPLWQPWNAYPSFDGGVSITRVGSKAFGNIASNTGAPVGMGKGGGGGGGGMATEVAAPAMADSKMMPPYEMTVYKYIYKGEIPLPTSDVEVLKRIKGGENIGALARSLSGFDLGLLDLGRLQNLKVTNFSLSEDRDMGYDAFVSVTEGSISINQNWQRWPDVFRDCKGEQSCYDNLRLKESDIMSDADALLLAAQFADKYGINLSSYGEAYVDQQWKTEYARYAVKTDFYFPDSLSVIYPLMIDGKAVYNQGGDKEGITFSINMRQKAVSGVWGLNTQKYEASTYAAATDAAQVQRFVEKGGFYSWQPPDATKTIDVELADPELVLMHYYDYSGTENTELILPALRFAIQNPPTDYYYPKVIMIPLVKDILDQAEKNNFPVPMPLAEPAATDTTTSSEPATTTEVAPADTATPAIAPAAPTEEVKPTSETTTLANPASVKCAEDGYTLDIITAEDGGQSGFCKNAEGKGCEEWAYFRGECEIPPVG